jgi:hypothetical protein
MFLKAYKQLNRAGASSWRQLTSNLKILDEYAQSPRSSTLLSILLHTSTPIKGELLADNLFNGVITASEDKDHFIWLG